MPMLQGCLQAQYFVLMSQYNKQQILNLMLWGHSHPVAAGNPELKADLILEYS
jgi:hypothetical protein